MTNPNMQMFSEAAKEKNVQIKKDGYLNDTPVYIVTFNGITKHTHNPIGSTMSNTVNKQYQIVLDANSGEILCGFTYQ